MRFQRAVTMAVTAAASTATAFTVTPPQARNYMTKSLVVDRAASSRFLTPSATSVRNNVGLSMVFERFFGGGGANALRIDYDKLNHPGPELGQWALEGKVPSHSEQDPHLKVATFAGGCFWGLELAYQRVPGVAYTAAGYTQGKEPEPNYNQVCSGATGHTEAVIVYYDEKECSYEQLLDAFFNRVNPTTVNGQGNDYGRQYRTGVYTHTKEQAEAAAKRFELEQTKYSKPIATELKASTPFWPAEKYHQQYLENGGRLGLPQDASKGATAEIRCYG